MASTTPLGDPFAEWPPEHYETPTEREERCMTVTKVVTSIPQNGTRHEAYAKTRHAVAADQSAAAQRANRWVTECGRVVYGWTDDRVDLLPVTCKTCLRHH